MNSVTCYILLTICYTLSDTCYPKLATSCKNLFPFYHTHQWTTNQPAQTRPSPIDKQSLSLNQVKAKLQTQRANQLSSSQVDGMGEGGVIKFSGS